MPMNWNIDADAKATPTNAKSSEQLFLGILNQLRDAKFKLDTKKLAEFMVPIYQHDGFDIVLMLMSLLTGQNASLAPLKRTLSDLGGWQSLDVLRVAVPMGMNDEGGGGDTSSRSGAGSDTSPSKRMAISEF
ncbi:hypothetical protein BDW60DRAFT_202857 [Aspergillus nidulans var. acristatus]